MINFETIQEMVTKIAKQFDPEKIILFGSYARGEATENSDVDLLVLMEPVAPRGQRSAPIIRMLAEAYVEPIDIVVRSPQGLEQWQDIPGSFAYQISKEGIVLYEKGK